MFKQLNRLFLVMLIGVLVAGGAAVSAQDEPYAPDIDPTNFVDGVNNPYFPLIPGTTFIYEAETEDGTERTEVSVLSETKQILDVTCVVVRDTVWVDGELIEDTWDWYAQDKDGNVWYMGEDTQEYEDGVVVSTEGAWEAGVDGAQPGIVMYADPQIGVSYRQEYYAGEAEDMADIVNLTESATVFYGTFDNLLVTNEWTPLDPGVAEHKYYAAGVGLILEVVVEGGSGRTELVDIITQDVMGDDDSCTPEKPAGWTIYFVQSGDTIEDLAAIIGTTPEKLNEANCFTDPGNLVTGSTFYGPLLSNQDTEVSSDTDEASMGEDENAINADTGGVDADEGDDGDDDEGD